MQAAYNRVCRGRADGRENEAFDALARKTQEMIDLGQPDALGKASPHLGEMRRLFFAVAWRHTAYVRTWFEKLAKESWLFADQSAYKELVARGEGAKDDPDALREVVLALLDARVALSASDAVHDLATIVKE
jgi:hypothetical protein